MDQNTAKPLSQSTLAPGGGQMARDDQDLYLSSSDNDALKLKILGTHVPGVEEPDVKPVLSIVEDIMSLARPLSADSITFGSQLPLHSKTSHDVLLHQNSSTALEIVKLLEYPINYTSYVITWRCAGGADLHSITMELLESLSNYSWDTKVVITYAAFAINYGDFWLLHQLHYRKNLLADSIATLMGAMGLGSTQLEMESKVVLNVLTAALEATRCIIEFKEIPSTYIIRQSPEIPIAAYWTMRSLLACTSTLMSLFGNFNEYITKKPSAAAKKLLLEHDRNLSAILQHMQTQLKICKDLVEDDKKYHVIKNSTMESANIDNIKVLNALIQSRGSLHYGAKKTKERLEVLRLKYVLLLISDLQVPPQELNVIRKINGNLSVRHEHEVFWLPILDLKTSMTDLQESQFCRLRKDMPWYSVDHPSLVERAAIKYIREDLHFVDKPMVIVLEPHGKLSLHNILPVMCIWGDMAFPFTQDRENELFATSAGNIDLLVGSIDPRVQEWIRENKVICLYGGDDVDWIREFTRSAQQAASTLNVPLEMLYTGTSKRLRDTRAVIKREKLSHSLEVEYIDWFWMRLNSLCNSKKQIGKTVEDNEIMQGIKNIVDFDSFGQSWALFSLANCEMTKVANGRFKVLPVLDKYTQWGNEVDRADKFVNVLDKQLRDYQPPLHCTRLVLPANTQNIPDRLVCHECGKIMEKYVIYNCDGE